MAFPICTKEKKLRKTAFLFSCYFFEYIHISRNFPVIYHTEKLWYCSWLAQVHNIKKIKGPKLFKRKVTRVTILTWNSEIRNVLKIQILVNSLASKIWHALTWDFHVTLHMMYYRNITCIWLDDVALGSQRGYWINISALYSLCKIWANSECQIRIIDTNAEMQICPPICFLVHYSIPSVCFVA